MRRAVSLAGSELQAQVDLGFLTSGKTASSQPVAMRSAGGKTTLTRVGVGAMARTTTAEQAVAHQTTAGQQILALTTAKRLVRATAGYDGVAKGYPTRRPGDANRTALGAIDRRQTDGGRF